MASIDRTFRRNLPHLRRAGATYFLTWTLADRGCGLTSAERDIVFNALRYFDGTRYDLVAAVVMDDHVHVLVRPLPDHPLSAILHSWKSFTAHQLVKVGRRGPVWLDEYRDSIIKSVEHLVRSTTYIANNPAQRWPGTADYPWLFLSPASSRRHPASS